MPIDLSTLDVTLDLSEDCLRRLRVTVPADVVADERAALVKQYSSRVKVKGFRAGRVPTDLVEKRFGDTIRSETMNRIVEQAYRSALEKTDLRPITDGSIGKIDWNDGEALSFAVEFEVQPDPEFSRIGGFKLEKTVREIAAEQVDAVLERVRFQQGVWTPAEGAPVEGDQVEVEITPLETEDGTEGELRPYQIVLGEGDALPEVEAAIVTLEPSQTSDFTIKFPADFPDESRRGAEHRLRIALLARKVRELPALDDAFARAAGSFDTVAELRTRVAEDLAKEAEEEAEARLRGQLLDFILDANPFPVPRSMVDGYMDSVMGDISEADPERLEEAREQLRPGAERAVMRFVTIDRLAAREGLEASKEEIDRKIQEIADKNDQAPARVASRLKKAGRFDGFVREITEEKVFAFLKEQSEITSAP